MKLQRSTPGKLGIRAQRILDFVNAVEEKKLGLHSFMLIRHGEVACEAWWKPYRPEFVHQLFSLSKSFTSTAVGFACQEGLLSIDDSVVSFFDEALPAGPCDNMKKMKVRNLLTMGTGHAKEPNALTGEKWAYNFLTSYIPLEPGSRFVYNTPATYMLSAIVQKATGEKVFDYLKPRLFEPLGMENIWWQESPEGVNTGGYGLNVHTEDIAKFGLFLLNRGSFNGKQLLNPEWIDLATSKQISNGDPEEENDWSQGYGFQFWRCKPEGVYRGDGAYGQYCVVMPKQDAVLAVTSGSGDIRQILKEAWAHLLPAMENGCEEEEENALEDALFALSVPMPAGEKPEFREREEYETGANPLGIRKIALTYGKDGARLEILFHEQDEYQKDIDIPVGYGEWKESGERFAHAMAACAKAQDGEILIRFVLVETPFIREVVFRRNEGFAEFVIRQNVGFPFENCVLYGKKI